MPLCAHPELTDDEDKSYFVGSENLQDRESTFPTDCLHFRSML